MKRKCLAVLLAATMVLTMAGCGSKDKEVTGDSSTEVTESVAEDTEGNQGGNRRGRSRRRCRRCRRRRRRSKQ